MQRAFIQTTEKQKHLTTPLSTPCTATSAAHRHGKECRWIHVLRLETQSKILEGVKRKNRNHVTTTRFTIHKKKKEEERKCRRPTEARDLTVEKVPRRRETSYRPLQTPAIRQVNCSERTCNSLLERKKEKEGKNKKNEKQTTARKMCGEKLSCTAAAKKNT